VYAADTPCQLQLLWTCIKWGLLPKLGSEKLLEPTEKERNRQQRQRSRDWKVQLRMQKKNRGSLQKGWGMMKLIGRNAGSAVESHSSVGLCQFSGGFLLFVASGEDSFLCTAPRRTHAQMGT
jgi:hypothetical protein